MLVQSKLYWQRAYRTGVFLQPLAPLLVQPFLLQLGRAFLAGLLMEFAMGPLTINAAVFDEETGRAILELGDAVVSARPPAVGADIRCRRQDAAHVFASQPIPRNFGASCSSAQRPTDAPASYGYPSVLASARVRGV